MIYNVVTHLFRIFPLQSLPYISIPISYSHITPICLLALTADSFNFPIIYINEIMWIYTFGWGLLFTWHHCFEIQYMLLYASIVFPLPLSFSIPPWIYQHFLIHYILMTFGLFLFFAIMIETGIDIHAQVFRYAFLFSIWWIPRGKWLGFK